MLKEFKKIWLDTLTNPTNGKYSRKSVTWLLGIQLIIVCVLGGIKTGNWVPEYIFLGLVGFVFGLGTLTVYEKLKKNGSNEQSEE